MGKLNDLIQKIQIPRPKDVSTTAYVNRDTMPLPPERRTFGPWSFVGLWIVTGSFNVGGWVTGGSLIVLGLNVWQSMLTVIIGNIMVGLICVLSGMPGAQWHIGFPILQKVSWGMYGGVFPLINRILLSFVWYSTQVYWGGQCTKTFIAALWPSFLNLDTPLADGTMTTADFTSFIIFSLLCLPIIWIPPERYQKPFGVAAITVIPTVFALLIWCTVTAGGGGALLENVSAFAGVPQATGSHLGWMLVLGIMSNIGSISTHIFSQSDFTRFAKKPRDQLIAQLIMVPLGTIVVALIGIICTSCGAQLYPQEPLLWTPYSLLAAIQKYAQNSSGSRAGVAFASLSFILAQLGIAVAENALSNGIDLSGLLPRYFNLHRGGYLTAAMAFVMQPWSLLNGANKFLSVIGGYGVFLGPFTGVMFSDYFIIRHRLLKLTDLYDVSAKSIYWYNKGLNWRAPVSWVLGFIFLMPGYAQWVRDSSVELPGWSKVYYLSWLLGCTISALLYYILHLIFPIRYIGLIDDVDYFGTFDHSYHPQPTVVVGRSMVEPKGNDQWDKA